jgi:triphosphoribosyl-dephospho-CoA synthase
MQELLPIKVVEIPRLETPDQVGGDGTTSCPAPTGHPVSASAVRAALEAGNYARAAALCPATTRPYLMAALAERALRLELDTPMKPGLVGPDSRGAHKDMDYALMLKAIAALRPYWSRMAKASVPPLLQMIGIEAEKTMKKATGGVNTHRGAIFALGLALNAHGMEVSVTEEVMYNNLEHIARMILCNQLTDSDLHSRVDGASPAGNAPSANLSHGAQAAKQYGVKGAREMALEGYKDLWADWLPYYRRSQNALLTLLRIMSTLDDTCVIHRVGYERAQEVKREAAALLEMADLVGHDGIRASAQPVMPGLTGHLCEAYAAEGISPGGAADMLALTIFIDSLTN